MHLGGRLCLFIINSQTDSNGVLMEVFTKGLSMVIEAGGNTVDVIPLLENHRALFPSKGLEEFYYKIISG